MSTPAKAPRVELSIVIIEPTGLILFTDTIYFEVKNKNHSLTSNARFLIAKRMLWLII